MFDTMTLTKAVGAFCGVFLIFLIGKSTGDAIYDVGGGHGGEHQQAYTIDTGEDDAVVAEAEPEASFEEVFASADPAAGEKLFRACAACHKVEAGANGTGPYLYGVVGREVDTATGYTQYSGQLELVADVWTPENLNAFLENPREYAPGTKMAYRGMPDMEDRANLIAWLDSLDN
jgi:cytochrome c